jgi:hypothetical protein
LIRRKSESYAVVDVEECPCGLSSSWNWLEPKVIRVKETQIFWNTTCPMNYVINEEMDPPDCKKKGVNMKRLTGSSILVQGLLLVVAASYPMLSSSETAPGLESVSSTVSSSETVKCVEGMDCMNDNERFV